MPARRSAGGARKDAGRPRRAGSRRARDVVALAAAAFIVAGGSGCASVHVASPLDDPRAPSTAVKRCSPSDPDRSAWFCVLGQFLYNLVGVMQPDGGYSLR